MVEKKLKRIFNENVLKKLKEKEIKSLPKKEKETTKYYETLIKNLKNKITDKENNNKKKKKFKKNTGKDFDDIDDDFELELLKTRKKKQKK